MELATVSVPIIKGRVFPWQFFKKIALVQAVFIFLAIFASSLVLRYYLQNKLVKKSKVEMQASLKVLSKTIGLDRKKLLNWCRNIEIDSKSQYSIFDENGSILCNAFGPLENRIAKKKHNTGKLDSEIAKTLKRGKGFSRRLIPPQSEEYLFAAIAITSSPITIIRQSIPFTYVKQDYLKLDKYILVYMIPLFLALTLISLYFGIGISTPLGNVLGKVNKLSKKFQGNDQSRPGDEWSKVESAVDQANKDIETYLEDLHSENKKFSTLIESLTDCILAVNKNEQILFFNHEFKKRFLDEKSNREDYIGKKIGRIGISRKVTKLLKIAIRNKQNQNLYSIKLNKDEQFIGHFDMRVSLLKEGHKKDVGAVIVLHDVTDKKLALKMRENFVTNVSHEVRTPLTALKGFVQIILGEQDKLPTNMIDPLDKILSNTERLTALFNDILDLSVIESETNLVVDPVDTSELTQRVISNVKQSYIGKEIELEFKQSINSGMIYGDPRMIEQVVTNLIENAFKYTVAPGKVFISWEEDEHEYILTVRDSGIGIPEKYQSRIFERFFRVDKSRARGMGGTGLGLAIVKHIIVKHNGRIKVDSQKDRGTTFTIELPKNLKEVMEVSEQYEVSDFELD